jgi:hypothetical protein
MWGERGETPFNSLEEAVNVIDGIEVVEHYDVSISLDVTV